MEQARGTYWAAVTRRQRKADVRSIQQVDPFREQRQALAFPRERPVGADVETRVRRDAECVAIGADEVRAALFGPVAGDREVAAGAKARADARTIGHAIGPVQVDRVTLIVVAPERLASPAILILRVRERVRRPSGKPIDVLPLHEPFHTARVTVERVDASRCDRSEDERAV